MRMTPPTKQGHGVRLDQRSFETGSAIIIVMMLTLVFIAMGVALFSLLSASRSSTELERKEVKAFNVAEAGIDAGMLALQQSWPSKSGQTATVDAGAIRGDFPTDQYRDPQRSATPFLDVSIYDNVTGNPSADRVQNVQYDANGDQRMWVDSWSDVDDDRHRILILAERNIWNLNLPDGMAMMAETADGRGANGIRILLEDGGPLGMAWAKYVYANGSGVNPAVTYGAGTYQWPTNWPTGLPVPDPTDEAHMAVFKTVAQNAGTYYGPGQASAAQTLLNTPNVAANKIVYVEFGPSDNEIRFSSNASYPIITGDDDDGTLAREQPLFLVLDTRNAPDLDYGLVITGNINFYGVICCNGSISIRGGAFVAGAVWASDVIECKGTGGHGSMHGGGNMDEIRYDASIINKLETAHTMSVNIVPNTWEEYTVSEPATAATAP